MQAECPFDRAAHFSHQRVVRRIGADHQSDTSAAMCYDA